MVTYLLGKSVLTIQDWSYFCTYR